MSRKKNFQGGGNLKVAVIGDEDTVAGFLMAGIGEQDGQGRTNFLLVKPQTPKTTIEETFKHFTQDRRDIAVVLINQHIAEDIRYLVDTHTAIIPTVLEIPSKDKPYDVAKDSMVQRIRVFFGGELPS